MKTFTRIVWWENIQHDNKKKHIDWMKLKKVGLRKKKLFNSHLNKWDFTLFYNLINGNLVRYDYTRFWCKIEYVALQTFLVTIFTTFNMSDRSRMIFLTPPRHNNKRKMRREKKKILQQLEIFFFLSFSSFTTHDMN